MNKWLLLMFNILLITHVHADPLPSWQEGKVKTAIINFVKKVTNRSSPSYVAEDNRIAAFAHDGTLWVEQPIYTQGIFAFDEVKSLAYQHPEWQTTPPFSYILRDDCKALAKLNMQDIIKILSVTHTGMSVSEFQRAVKKWFRSAKDQRFKQLYMKLTYLPMLEVMQYLRDHHFKIYIVTGGGQDFVRAIAPQLYYVASENVIGSANKTHYSTNRLPRELINEPAVLLVNEKAAKPENINLFVGKRPIISFGNSEGDREMLEWTQSGTGEHLTLLVHHDDAKREYAYGPNTKIGLSSNSLIDEAKKNQWQIISMQRDWKKIFAFE